MSDATRENGLVIFKFGINAEIVGSENRWRRNCKILDVSATGARLSIQGGLDGLDIREFVLVLPSRGQVFRRCQKRELDGDVIGVEFLPPNALESNDNPQLPNT